MAKARSTEEGLAAVRAIREAPEKYDLKRDLAPFLRHKSNHVAAAAADAAGRLEAAALAQDLADAFLKWMENPAARDPGCSALTAIAKTLVALEHPAAQAYLAGVRHVQKEASFGPPVDAAAALRGLCAQGLARMSHPDALLECATLLADPEPPARAGAIRAIGETGQTAGVLLLRFKALIGDPEDEVMAECFAVLLGMAPEQSLEFVARLLGSASAQVRERAALALGESRLPAAFAVLREAWEGTALASWRRTLLVAIAMLRRDPAVEFLLERLAEDAEKPAADALAALSLYSGDDSVRKRIERILATRKSAALRGVFEKTFNR